MTLALIITVYSSSHLSVVMKQCRVKKMFHDVFKEEKEYLKVKEVEFIHVL